MRSQYLRQRVRIVMPLQADESTWTCLDFAAAMAKALQGELRGLFLEDAEALTAATLPFTQTIAFQSGRLGAFDVAQLQAAYRARAGQARARLAALCQAQALAWSFEMAGRAALPAPGAMPEQPAAFDLLLLDRRALHLKQWSAALLRLATDHNTVAVWDTRLQRPSQIILVYQGEEETLGVAAQLAEALEVELEILIHEPDAEATARYAAEVHDWLQSGRVRATVHELSSADPDSAKSYFAERASALVLFGRKDLIDALTT